MTMLGLQPYRGMIHFHSRYSPDSITSLRRILAVARRHALDFMILTDHDTLRGARELARRARALGLPLEVPLAAEYRTDHGDLIAAFVREEIAARNLEGFVAEVRGQEGLILLPHRLVDHRDPETLARHADLIEVFNGRAGAAANQAAAELAARAGKPGFWASDAHLACSLGRTAVTVENRGPLKDSLLHGAIRPLACRPAARCDIFLSQAIKVVKTGDVRRAVRFAARRACHVAQRLAGKRRPRRAESGGTMSGEDG
jgi:predicted metal-dependent phosphoesterase TrpH